MPARSALQATCSRDSSRSTKKQRRVDEVIEAELQLDSRTDSFNSEEGFGSPVRNRCEWRGRAGGGCVTSSLAGAQ